MFDGLFPQLGRCNHNQTPLAVQSKGNGPRSESSTNEHLVCWLFFVVYPGILFVGPPILRCKLCNLFCVFLRTNNLLCLSKIYHQMMTRVSSSHTKNSRYLPPKKSVEEKWAVTSSPWLFAGYRGWATTQLHGSFNKPIVRIPRIQSVFHGMSAKGFEPCSPQKKKPLDFGDSGFAQRPESDALSAHLRCKKSTKIMENGKTSWHVVKLNNPFPFSGNAFVQLWGN